MDEQYRDMRVGVAWYAEPEWQTLRAVAADPETLEPTYDEWLKVFENGLRDLAAAGVVAERVEVRVAHLRAWCQAQRRPLDGAARAAFAAELLHRRHQGAVGGGA
jgi:hypothetical protein